MMFWLGALPFALPLEWIEFETAGAEERGRGLFED